MNFKKIEIAGFKSFADKLEVKFGGGITAIVGPNGCGKSNVADAIRWVLGEQSPRLLRGTSMQDVIFNGTEKRKSLSYAEVSLFFDNTNRIFPLEYNEVVISRKLYRSGESEYFLNRSNCRLKDIVNLLRDSGMGREGYSVIGQGKIDSILSAKPEDRRAIFEEAAGISKNKAVKLESERKLERVTDNLNQIRAVLEREASHLEPLTKQAEVARKYLGLRDTLKDLEVNTYIHQFDSASNAKSVIQTRLNAICEEYDIKNRDYERTNAEYNENYESITNIDKKLKELNERILEVTVEIEKKSGEVSLIAERISFQNAVLTRLENEKQKHIVSRDMLTSYIDDGKKKQAELSERLEQERASHEAVRSEYDLVGAELSEYESSMEQGHRDVLEAMTKLSDIKANMSRLIAEREALSARGADLSKRTAAIKRRAADDSAALNDARGEINDVVARRAVLLKQEEAFDEAVKEAGVRLAELSEQLNRLNSAFYNQSARRDALKEMKDAFMDFGFAIKKLLNDAKEKNEVKRNIMGVVGQILSVGQMYETAIETALGNAIQNVITKNEENAKELIEYLKAQRYGRVTFMPLSSVKPRSVDSVYLPYLRREGVLGVASDLVKYDAIFSNAVLNLLGGTVVTDNINTAISLARQTDYNIKIVTLDGEVINTSGTITGGSKRVETGGIFSHERELNELNAVLEQTSGTLEGISVEKTELGKLLDSHNESLSECRANIHALDVEISAMREKALRLSDTVTEAHREVFVLEQEHKSVSERLDEIAADLNSVSELEGMAQSTTTSASGGRAEVQARYDLRRQKRNELGQALLEGSARIAAMENESGSIIKEIERLQTNLSNVEADLSNNAASVVAAKNAIAELEKSRQEYYSTSDMSDVQKLNALKSELNSLDEYKDSKQSALARVDRERGYLVGELQRLNEARAREEMQMQKVDTDIEAMELRIQEEYELTYDDCVQLKRDDFDVVKATGEISRIKKQIQSLGNININAIEESKILFEKYNAEMLHKEDLERAQNDLNKLIKELSREMVEKFSTEFEKIRQNFIKIFAELFNGGKADLRLLDNEDMLEAGIEIYAQPPEKRLQSIMLLSGGERALTAIAILFAILRLKPMPFCVLDEIEAALDDENARRFATYLHRFSKETQFIVITHRKPTMELSDSLFGVTMEEKGVSKIISVKLSTALELEEKGST